MRLTKLIVCYGVARLIEWRYFRYAYTTEPYAPYPFTAKPQLAWLEADLKAANANRATVPCEYNIIILYLDLITLLAAVDAGRDAWNSVTICPRHRIFEMLLIYCY